MYKRTHNLASTSVITLISLLFISCSPSNEKKNSTIDINPDYKPKVIYGEDNRLDLYEVTDPAILQLADATVSLMRDSSLLPLNTGRTQIVGRQFGSSYGLCESEPFYYQNTAAFCSGSLVGPDLVMTAGHCVNQKNCGRVNFVFGFGVHSEGNLPDTVSSKEVYRCSKVLTSEVRTSGGDFAIVRLDRVVEGHQALPIRRSGSLKIGDPLLVIGHPSGLPTKVAGGAKVRSIKSEHLVTNLDTYGGNSGSAVFNATTGLIEGILVRGATDFVYKNGCRVSNICAKGECQGEDVTKVSLVKNFIPNINPPPPTEPTEDSFYEIESTTYQEIPDFSAMGISSQLTTTRASAQNQKLSIQLDIEHPWRGDLKVKITSPAGESFLLHNREGSSQNDIKKTFHLKGHFSSGTWTLKISDLGKWDTGSLKYWSIQYK